MNVARGKFAQRNPAATFVFLLAWLGLPAAATPFASVQSASAAPMQSVAEAAKQKSSDRKSKRVYTNDDFPSVELVEPAAKNEDKPSDGAAASGAPVAPAGSGNDSAEVKQARKAVETKTIQIDTLTEEKTALDSRLHEGNRSPDESAAISESIRNVDAKIGALKKERDDAQKVIDAAGKPKPQDQN